MILLQWKPSVIRDRHLKRRTFAVAPPRWLRGGVLGALILLAACSDPASDAGGAPPTAATPKPRAAAPVIAAVQYSPSLYGNYLAAIHARSQNDSTAAADFMNKVLAADPKNINVLQMAFLLNVQDGATKQALSLAKQLLEAQPDNQLAQISQISEAFRKHDYALAKTQIGALDEQGLGELLKPMLGAWAEVGLGNMDAVLNSLDPVSKRKSFQPFYSFHRALVASLANRDALAEQYFTELLDDSGNRSIRAAQAFGAFLETRNQYPRAVEVYRRFLLPAQPHPVLTAALARNEARQPAHLLINDATMGAAEVLYGLASVLSQDPAPSHLPLIYLRLAIHINPEFEEAKFLLAGILESLSRHEEAIALYFSLPETSPQFETARIQLALNEAALGRTDDAIKKLRQYTEKYPDRSAQALLSLADLLRTHERYEEAIPVYDKIIAGLSPIKPHHWQMIYARGITLERAGKWPLAERDLMHALKLEPEQPNVLNYLAYSWIDKGLNLERAKTMIESAAQQRPDDGAIIDSLGWIQYRTGDFIRAVGTLENAISLIPQDAVINDHLGDAYWQVGRRLEAQFQWRRALSFEPSEEVRRGIEKKLQSGLESITVPLKPVMTRAQ